MASLYGYDPSWSSPEKIQKSTRHFGDIERKNGRGEREEDIFELSRCLNGLCNVRCPYRPEEVRGTFDHMCYDTHRSVFIGN